MRPTKSLIGQTITIVNRPPREHFKRLRGRLLGRERGIIIVETLPYHTARRFRLSEWTIERLVTP